MPPPRTSTNSKNVELQMCLQEFLETILVLHPLCDHSPKLQITFEFGASRIFESLIIHAPFRTLNSSSSMLRPSIESPSMQEQLERHPRPLEVE